MQVRAPVVVHVLLSVEAVTTYLDIGLPPVVGALQVTAASPTPAFAVGAHGLAGTEAGVTAVEGGDGVLVPTPFVAVTVKV